MPSSAHQSSARLVEAAAGGALSPPSNVAVLALGISDVAPAGNNSFNTDFTGIAGLAFRVIDVWLVKTAGNAAATDTYQVQRDPGAPANVTDAISVGVGFPDQRVARCTQIDDAAHAFPAGTGLRVAVTDGAADGLNKSCICYVEIALT